MPRRDPQERGADFLEVALGLDPKQAMAEAERCLNCKHKPCVSGCPVQVPIPEFIQLVVQGEFEAADAKIKEKNSLPAICGRVCPQETQCEEVCVFAKRGQPIAIGMLERFVADQASAAKKSREAERSSVKPEKKYDERIAVIGAGPAGLTCGADLAGYGYEVDIFEALHDTGGVLRYGIPEFRLPKSIVDEEVEYVKSLGVNITTNIAVGLTMDFNEMLRSGKYAAAFIGTGAGLPNFLNIPGENLNGVYSANEFLTRANLMKAYLFPEYDTPIKVGKRVAVVGAGNVAMDAARVSLRLGAEDVYIVYRRSREEMPARHEEIENAEEEGIQFRLLTNPARILGDERFRVQGMECVKMELGEPDSSGRRRPVEIPNSNFTLEVDTVIIAVGQGANPMLTTRVDGLELNKWGNIATFDEAGATSIPGVWAGGDIATGASTVISAMGAGKRSALAIHEWLTTKRVES
ncbi:MAG: NADPH-dependent glutamate synthase [Limnochordia bacterium]|nr:NADPH-dependent glutamate synthase [Limnochordia bacterium]